MEKETFDKGIVFKNIEDFDLKHTFDCGQCFRWIENNDGSFTGVAFKRQLEYIKRIKIYILKGQNIMMLNFGKDILI